MWKKGDFPMGVLARAQRLIKSNINEILEKAEDPEKTLKQCVRDMEASVAETRQKVTEAIAGQKLLGHKSAKQAAEAEKWENRAVLALKKGEDDLAREAVLQKRRSDIMAGTLTTEEKRQAEAVDVLRRSLAALEAKLAEAKQKRDILIARKRQAETRKDLLDEVKGVASAGSNVDTSAFQAFEEVEDRIMDLESEVEALAEMGEMLDEKRAGGASTADVAFEQMEQEDFVDRELERLREKARAEE
jgi:phage shock protein A